MCVPAGTYRLQITAEFTLFDAAATLSYLHDLGIDWVYLSPLLRAEPGSPHGYDVVDHTAVDPARGGADGLAALSAEARRLGMGVLVDIVPNHMGVATPHENAWWWDLLTHGRGSAYAAAFDVDWDAGGERVLLPVVGDDDLLEDGRIGHLSVVGDELRYHDLRLPLRPDDPAAAPAQPPAAEPAQTPAAAPAHIPAVEPVETPDGEPAHIPAVEPVETPDGEPAHIPRVEPVQTPAVEPVETPAVEPAETPDVVPARTPAVEPVETPAVEPVETPDGEPAHIPRVEPVQTPAVEPVETPDGEPAHIPAVEPAETPDVVPARTPAAEPVETAAVEPVETPDADQLHARQLYRLVSWRRGDRELNYRRFFSITSLAGIRVEDRATFEASHQQIRRWFDAGLVDGLRIDHPDGLRDPAAYLVALRELTGGAYVAVEKILEPGERLPPSWATAGTTGYDVLGLVDRVLVDPDGQPGLTALETRLRGSVLDWSELVHERKRMVADETLHAEVARLAREIAGVGVPDQRVDAIAELLACFPVYRSYLPDGRGHLEAAFASAGRRRPDLAAALDLLRPVLGDSGSPVARRFQQTSGAVMAKAVEDCAFYRTSRLTSLTEVGGDPSEFAVSVEEFHAAMVERQRLWPQAMTATTTHDTKRSEDTRARISVLAEVPELWSETVGTLLERAPMPDPSFGNLLWQAVVGAWPASRARLHGYAEKAMRESGEHTTWADPDAAYEDVVHRAVDAAFDDDAVRDVLERFVERVAAPGYSNGLAAKLVALTMPGVPDVYQGTELWDGSLVDPDNRRPVDFGVRRDVLERVRAGDRPALSPHADDHGGAKLVVTHAALTLRRDQPHRFTSYEPVRADGDAAGHVLAFDRGGALTVVTRLPVGLAERGWGDTTLPLPDGAWADVLSGREYADHAALHELLADYPVALLIREES